MSSFGGGVDIRAHNGYLTDTAIWTLAIQKRDRVILPPLKCCHQHLFIKCIKKGPDTGLHLKNTMHSVSRYSFRRMAVNVIHFGFPARVYDKGQSCLETESSERNS